MKHPVRLYLLLFFLVFPLVSVLSAEETLEQSAIALVERFLDRLEQETPWEYSEEESLFYAPVSSWVLMMQAGIMKEDGTWTEAEPKLSLFGQLLQSRRELFFFPDSEKQLIFSAEKNAETGSVILLYRKKKRGPFPNSTKLRFRNASFLQSPIIRRKAGLIPGSIWIIRSSTVGICPICSASQPARKKS